MTAGNIVVATFVAVLLAEIVGDRSMLAVASLGARFTARSVLLGVTAAYALKMLIAVMIAGAIAHIAQPALAALSAATWLVTGWAVWRREKGEQRVALAGAPACVVAFVSIAFTEWGDPGQLTAAVLAARFRAPLLVWSAATAALLTKAGAALFLGATAKQHLNVAWLRTAAAGFCLMNAVLSMLPIVRAAFT